MARWSASVLCVVAGLALASTAGRAGEQSELVIQKTGTKEYHRPHCEVIRDGKGVLALTRAQAESRGLTPHAGCDPEKAPPPSARGRGEPTPAAPVFVFLDAGEYYHKEDCKKLGKAPKKAALEKAGKTHWPCPTCKPPIRKRSAGKNRDVSG